MALRLFGNDGGILQLHLLINVYARSYLEMVCAVLQIP